MNKYEKLIEHIINNDEAKARALFHDIVVEKSREIYESLMDEESMEEDIHAQNPVEGMVDEITMDETHIGEDDEEGSEMEFDLDSSDGDELGGDLPADGMDDMGGEEDLETKVMDLEAELDSLKAEFAKISGDMGDEEGDEESFGDEGDEEGDEESFGDEGDEEESPEEMYESSEEDDDEEEDDEEEMTESRQRPRYQKTAVDLMREYVEKISAPSNTEFTPVGTGTGGDKPAGNTKNPLAGKNDMGGTTANIVKGGTEQAPDGNSPKGKAGGFLKNAQEIDVAKRNVNKPGGNKGAQDWYNTKASAKKGEGQTTDGSVPVQKKSIEPGGN
jgi:hypothetical protein